MRRLHLLVERLLFAASAVALTAMMLLVSADVVARYFFNAPLTFQFELTTEYLMVIVATLALPWSERHGAFIRLHVVRHFISGPTAARLDAVNGLVASAAFFAIAWYSGLRTVDKWIGGDAIFGVIDWPVWVSLVWVPVGCFMLAVRLALNALFRWRDSAGGAADVAEGQS